MLKTYFALVTLTALLCGCAGNPYHISNATAQFNGKAQITSNLSNICTQTNGKYALKIIQRIANGFDGKTWYTCTPSKTIDYNGNYHLYFDIVKNDGIGKTVINVCDINHANQQTQLSHVQLHFTRNHDTPSCVALIS